MYIRVFVTPGAKHEKVVVRPGKGADTNETLAISVREPASGNRANDRVRELVALRFGQPIGKVRILTGHRSRGKMLSISS